MCGVGSDDMRYWKRLIIHTGVMQRTVMRCFFCLDYTVTVLRVEMVVGSCRLSCRVLACCLLFLLIDF
jgi:hypothetical protein